MSRIATCATELLNQFEGLTIEDLKDYAKDVLSLTRSDAYKGLKGQAAIAKAQAEIGDDLRRGFFEDAQTVLNNQEKRAYLETMIKDGKITLRDLVGMRYMGKGDNIEISQKAAQNRMIETAFGKLDAEDVAYLQNKANQMEIASAFDGYKANPRAEKIADNLKQYLVDSGAEVVASGALPLRFMQNRRFLGAVHDRAAMLKGGRTSMLSAAKNPIGLAVSDAKTKWREVIKSKLNLEETFGATDAMLEDGTLNMSEVDKIIDRTYDNIMNGRSEIFTKSVVLNDAESVAKRSRMFFVYKDMKSFVEYNDVYGQGNLMSAIMHDVEAKGRKIGRSELLGSDPDISFSKLKQTQQEADPKSPRWNYYTDLYYKEVRGDSSAAVSPTMANFFGNMRSLSSMARLPTLLVSSLTDANMAASYAWRWGDSYGKALIKQFEAVLAPASSEERKAIGKMFHLDLKAHMGMQGKFTDVESMGDLTQKLSTKYYRAIGMTRWDKGNRMGSMETLAENLGRNSIKKFDELPNLVKKQLQKHGVENNEWEILRKHSQKGYFSLDNIEAITNSDLKNIYDLRGGKVPMHQIKNELYRKVYSMFEAAQENAILTPNAWARTLMNQGTVTGTWAGEAMRKFSQFKGFSISYMDRALIEGFKDADGAMGKFYFALQQFGMIMPLSYMSSWAYFLSQGLSMPDPTEMTYPEMVSFYAGIAMPGMGAFLGILDDGNQNQNLLLSTILTPSVRLLSNSLAAPLSLATGNPSQALKNLEKALQYALPLTTLPGASPYIKSFLGDEPFLQPGQTQLYGG